MNNKQEKLFRTFLLGSICYIIIHALLNSKKFLENEIINKYKKYLLYLVFADLSLASVLIFIIDKKVDIEDNLYIEDISEKSTENNNLIQNLNNKQLLNNKSPFIQKQNKSGEDNNKQSIKINKQLVLNNKSGEETNSKDNNTKDNNTKDDKDDKDDKNINEIKEHNDNTNNTNNTNNKTNNETNNEIITDTSILTYNKN
jgi:hypothetical protein